MNTREPTGLPLRRQRENVKSQHHASTFTSSCPAKRGRGTTLRSRVVEGASASKLALPPHAPSTTLRVVPLPRTSCGGGQNEIVLAARSCVRALPTTTTPKIDSLPAIKEGSGAPKGACQPLPPRRQACAFAPLVCGRAAARSFGARSPSGALLRHSPGRTHPPLAQLQFPRFLRPDLTGITRFDLSRVYRAPRRPVIMPVERWPRAARERMANPPAGTAPRSAFGALNERGGRVCNRNEDICQGISHGTRDGR
jgi:hypothetical protein